MQENHRELYFFTEKYSDGKGNYSAKHKARKNTMNYMNRFTISEADAFDIAGYYEVEKSFAAFYNNKKQRQKIPKSISNCIRNTLSGFDCDQISTLRHLSKACGIVHIFISGMLLYTDHRDDNIRYVRLQNIIDACLSNIAVNRVQTIRTGIQRLFGPHSSSLDFRDFLIVRFNPRIKLD